MIRRPLTILLLVAAALGACAAGVRADAFWIASASGGQALQTPSVKILGIKDDQLLFRSASGRESDRPLSTIARLQIDGESALNSAEEAYLDGKWDIATDDYLKAMRSTTKEWLHPWITRRLMESADKARRFDAAVSAYLDLVLRDPAHAAEIKPSLPDARSSFLSSAANEINQALNNPKLTSDQKQLMLSFLLDIHRARKDQSAVEATMQQMLNLGTAAGAPGGAGAAPPLARLKLDIASVAIDGGQFQKAIDEINASRSIFTDPRDQADALFYLAQAQYGLAAQEKQPAALEKAAIAYLRVVAHFKDAPSQPHVAESLLKTAEIEEALNDRQTALSLYQQIATQFNDSASAPKAREAIERLKGDAQQSR